MLIEKWLKRIKDGKNIDFVSAYELATTVAPQQLFEAADNIRKAIHGHYFDLCSIVNAKSGKCSEDCRFCAQSAHYEVNIETYDIITTEEALIQAKDNDLHGVKRLSLVAAGRSANLEDLKKYEIIYKKLGAETKLLFCASMGMLTPENAELLKSFGVERYHCNLETCRSYFPQICTTHSYDEKVETIKIAQNAGFEVCSGGIIGIGETLEQRLELAFELRGLGIMSIPINVFTPIANTPFADLEPLHLAEILTCIAIFRFINPLAVVRLAGGRNQFGEDQYQFFAAGVNGAIVGNYLTTTGNNLGNDLERIEDCGYTFREDDNG